MIPIFEMTLSITRNDLLVSSKPPRRNPYLKAVDYVADGKLRDSQKTTWFTENYMIHWKLRDSRGPCRDNLGITIFLWKTTWFTKNYVIHVKLRDSR
jgi:hypothetical protein